MHPMMGLAALHGITAVRYVLIDKVRLVRHLTDGALAIYDSSTTQGPTLGCIGSFGNYELVPLSSFAAWDEVTPEMLERLLDKP